jgi:DNA-binding NtrC family response regulator
MNPIAGQSRVEAPTNPAIERIIGVSAWADQVRRSIELVAAHQSSVLIMGPSGTGKELIARAIHACSTRAKKAFVPVDCAVTTGTLFASHMFGHVKGSFTGAARDHRGCFQEAHGGTLFLDELGNLSLALQAKLLRAIQQREVLPVGGSRALPVDVRIVAATNADLEGEIRRGTFRQDLLYRLNPGAALWLPPLRDRPEDIPLLVEHFLQELSAASGWPAPEIDPDAMTLLQDWPWPGNIRELRQVIETASVESGGAPIGPEHLGPLAPAARRAVPLLLTSADPEEDWERLWPLRRDEVHRLRAVTLRVPALNERDPRALRSAVLASLAGRPIRSRALAVLEHRAWWGHYTELDHAMEAVRHNIEGVVDLTNLEARLPHLVQDSGRAPLEVLMFPSRGEDGRVQGLHQVVREGALVIGRASSLRDLEPGPHTPPEVAARLKRRANALHELLGSHQPAFLRLDLLPQLARAHLVIQHAGEGLKIHALPELELPIEVWGANDPLAFALLPERSVDVGPAAELRLLSGDGEQVLLRLFVFKGALAREDLAARLIQRSGADAVAETLGVPSAVAGDGDGERGYRGLDVAEREAFIRLLRTWFETGGAFAIHVRQFARKISEDPLIGWLGRRLDTVHPTQDCGRLVEHKDNEALRAELVAELRRQPDARAACDRLPKRLRDTLSPRLD